MRYLIKYTKNSDIKFISHLDLMRTIQRVIRRANLPIEYSKGFNPHMSISIAQPLSVGMYSDGEYLDVVFEKEMNDFYIKDKLNENAPPGIRFLESVKVVSKDEKKVPQAMAMVEAAKYIIRIKYDNTTALQDELKNLLEQKELITVKKGKNGERTIDMKPMIKEFSFTIDNGELTINTIVSCGSKENLSADLLASYIKDFTSNANKDAFVDIKRDEMFVMSNNKFIPLYKYVK